MRHPPGGVPKDRADAGSISAASRDDRDRRTLPAQVERLEQEIAAIVPETTLVMKELDRPRESRIFRRGDFRTPGEPVEPATPAVLHPLPDGPRDRLALARWLVDRDNPLIARVTVNRWWAELFGHGLVTTVEDFGLKGEPPTHPELLDWLAVEFMDDGWSMKQLLRTIVLSATYRQSSRVTPELLARDDRNRLYARGPRFRLDAEMIRDNALAIAGLLSLEAGGPADPAVSARRALDQGRRREVRLRRQPRRASATAAASTSSGSGGAPYPSFVNFDATERLTCTVQRSRSNTPLQALTLLNDPVYVEAALALAAARAGRGAGRGRRRASRSTPSGSALARRPDAAELADPARRSINAQLEASRADPQAIRTLGTSPIPAGVSRRRNSPPGTPWPRRC